VRVKAQAIKDRVLLALRVVLDFVGFDILSKVLRRAHGDGCGSVSNSAAR